MFRSDNTLNLLIGADIARTAGIVINDRAAAAYIANGEIVVLGDNDNILPAGSTYADHKHITVVQRLGAVAGTSQLLRSLRIEGSGVNSYNGSSYQAPQEQRYFIGFDGTTSSIDALSSNDYILRIQYKHNTSVNSQQANTKSYYFSSDASATQQEVARNFAVQIGTDSGADVLAERLCSDAGVALGATLTVTNESTAVTASVANALVVGDYVRIGGTAVTDPVYRIATSTNGGVNLVLDEPYQAASGTGVAAERITAALSQAAATNFGIRLTGEAQDFTVGKLKYNRVAFDLSLGRFGTTVVNQFQERRLGNGVAEQISELEWFAQGFDGIIDRFGDSSPTIRAATVAGETYDTIGIQWVDRSASSPISGTPPSPNELMIALPDGAAQTVNILAQLNPWMASLPKAFAAVVV